MEELFGNAITAVLVVLGISVMIALTGLLALVRSIRRLRIPPDADFFTTMRYVPITLVVLLDLLDFGLDIFSAPISWIILDRMGLYGLRNKAAIEALIPFTQPIPTFTLSWIVARLIDRGALPDRRQRWEPGSPGGPRRRRNPTVIDMDDRSIR